MAFIKGQSGCPTGRPKGIVTARMRFRKMFEDGGPEIIENLISMAKAGDMEAIKICIDRICPKIKDSSVDFVMPELKGRTPEQLTQELFEGMSGQEMTAEEVNCVLNMIKTFRAAEDQDSVKEMIAKSNEVLATLRAKHEKEH